MFLNMRTGNVTASLEVDCDTGTRLLETLVKDFLPIIEIEEYELSYKRKYETLDSSADFYRILVGLYSQGTVYDISDSTVMIDKNKKLKESKAKLSEILDYCKFYKRYLKECSAQDIPNYDNVFKNLLNIYSDMSDKSLKLMRDSLAITPEDVTAYRLVYRARFSDDLSGVTPIDTKDPVLLSVIVKDLGRRLQVILNLFETSTKELGVFDSEVGDIVTRGNATAGILRC